MTRGQRSRHLMLWLIIGPLTLAALAMAVLMRAGSAGVAP